jgi:acetaldehyde dehydrogenase
MIMRDTVTVLADACDRSRLIGSVHKMIATVAGYVPGYRLKQQVQIQEVPPGDRRRALVAGPARERDLWHVSVFLEVEGAAHYLPSYAGNLYIMTSAALRVGEVAAGWPALTGAR